MKKYFIKILPIIKLNSKAFKIIVPKYIFFCFLCFVNKRDSSYTYL